LQYTELKGDFAMGSINKVVARKPSIVTWLDAVQMSEADRKIAKAYLCKTEAVLDLLWLTGAKIRAAFARSHANRTRAGSGLSHQ
jgi:hypothetical protein